MASLVLPYCVLLQYSHHNEGVPGLFETTRQIYCVLLRQSCCPTDALGPNGTAIELTFVILQYVHGFECASGLLDKALEQEYVLLQYSNFPS